MSVKKTSVAMAAAALALGLAACGGGDGTTQKDGAGGAKITRAQWESVRLGTPKQQVIDRFGAPTSSYDTKGKFPTYGYLTPVFDTDVSFTFEGDTGELDTKVWTEGTGATKARISMAEFRGIRTGMTQTQVEKKLGLPFDRTDEVTRVATPSNRNTPGLLAHCIHYFARTSAEFCFDHAGKLFYKNA